MDGVRTPTLAQASVARRIVKYLKITARRRSEASQLWRTQAESQGFEPWIRLLV